jgi:hypothetical protein
VIALHSVPLTSAKTFAVLTINGAEANPLVSPGATSSQLSVTTPIPLETLSVAINTI